MELQEAYQSFHNFNGNILIVETKDVRLPVFYIKFSDGQLPHLLGLHKLYRKPATKLVEQLRVGEITLEKIKRHQNFSLIKERIENFDFVIQTFSTPSHSFVIQVSKVDSDNRMRLDLVFNGHRRNRKLVIGLRRSKEDSEIFRPVTFFVTKNKKFDYLHSRRVEVTNMLWMASN